MTTNETNTTTTIIATVQPTMVNQVTEQLRNMQGVSFYSPVSGRFDLVLQLKPTEPKQVYELVNKIHAIKGITSARTYTPFEGYADGKNYKPTDALAMVLLQLNEQPAAGVLQAMKQLPQIRNAFVVPGEFDIIATVYGKNQEEIASQVQRIDELQGVRTSETLFAYKPIWQ
jgi:DNA-binding Lrp family transcriptional regulator